MAARLNVMLSSLHGETRAADLLDHSLLGGPQVAEVIALRLNGRLDFIADLENSFSALVPLMCRVKHGYGRACI